MKPDEELPTIRIKVSTGWGRINLSDFDPAIHEEWTDGEEGKAVSEAAPETEGPMMPRRGRPPKVRG